MQEDVEARERFMATLHWLLALKGRHESGIDFGLICVEFSDAVQLGNAYGAARAAQMLADVTERLRGAFRETDLVARDGADFWILVPMTEAGAVVNKVKETVDLAAENGLDVVPHEISIFNFNSASVSIPEIGTSATEFLRRLKTAFKVHAALRK